MSTPLPGDRSTTAPPPAGGGAAAAVAVRTIFDDVPPPEPARSAEAASRAPSSSEHPGATGGALARLWAPFLYLRAAHPRQAALTALGLGGAALLADREPREAALVAATVVIGQVVLGWHNDLVDQPVDEAHARHGKPVADGRIDSGNVWFTLCCAVLLLVPVAVSNGVVAGACYLGSVAVGMIGNVALRRGLLSFLPWALSFALYPFFLSYGGWGGSTAGHPPEPAIVALAALLGVGVHVLTALWGLVADHEDGWSYLPLRLGMRLGATRLLVLTLVYLAVVVGALLYAGSQVGLSR